MLKDELRDELRGGDNEIDFDGVEETDGKEVIESEALSDGIMIGTNDKEAENDCELVLLAVCDSLRETDGDDDFVDDSLALLERVGVLE